MENLSTIQPGFTRQTTRQNNDSCCPNIQGGSHSLIRTLFVPTFVFAVTFAVAGKGGYCCPNSARLETAICISLYPNMETRRCCSWPSMRAHEGRRFSALLYNYIVSVQGIIAVLPRLRRVLSPSTVAQNCLPVLSPRAENLSERRVNLELIAHNHSKSSLTSYAFTAHEKMHASGHITCLRTDCT